jgi:hypothetical protein
MLAKRFTIPASFIALPHLLAAFALLLSTRIVCANEYQDQVTGTWKLTAALDAADIASRDEREARELIGRVLVIAADKVTFDHRVCGPSSFEATSVEPRLYLREQFRASAENLRLPNPVTVVALSCTAVFIKGRDKLTVFWDGWFFDAIRLDATRAGAR